MQHEQPFCEIVVIACVFLGSFDLIHKPYPVSHILYPISYIHKILIASHVLNVE